MKLFLELNEKEAGKIFEVVKSFNVENETAPVTAQLAPAITSASPIQEGPVIMPPVNYPPVNEQQPTPVYQPPVQVSPVQTAPVYQQPPYEVYPQNPIVPSPEQPPMQTPAPLQVAPVVPTTQINYTQEQLAVAATQLMDAGKRNELIQMLASFGVQALTELPKEHYGAFANNLRGLGAKI